MEDLRKTATTLYSKLILAEKAKPSRQQPTDVVALAPIFTLPLLRPTSPSTNTDTLIQKITARVSRLGQEGVPANIMQDLQLTTAELYTKLLAAVPRR